jgi:hypothetical protein
MAKQQNIPVDSLTNEVNAKYQKNGLTYISNIPTVNVRDEAGNIRFVEDQKNPLVIIEPVSTNITTKSIIKVLNTQFNYFKFPARTTVVEEDALDIDLDVAILDLEQDPIFARYKPSENRKIVAIAAPTYSGILLDVVEDGQFQRQPNGYYITREVKQSGKDLRFRVQILHSFTSLDNSLTASVAAFSIIKNSGAQVIRNYIAPFYANDSSSSGTGAVTEGEHVTEIDVVILNSEFEQGDIFSVGARADHNNANNYHTIVADRTVLSVTDASLNVDTFNNEIE